MIIVLTICPLNVSAITDSVSTEIQIDDMKSSNDWHQNKDDQRNCSIDLTPVGNGLKISYNLEENESWVEIYRDIDFSRIPKIDKLSFQFAGNGDPNTLELKLVYEDDSNFGYEYNRATNSSGIVSLYPWQIRYWWSGKSRPDTETVDFSKVKQIRFAVSNNPDKKDTLGTGFVVISGIVGDSLPTEIPWWERNKDIIIALIGSISSILFGIIGYRLGSKQ